MNNISTYYDGKYNKYVGARYVPIFADPSTWDNTKTYEPLTIVLYQGNSYTSKTFVPVGIDITNNSYWIETGNYNAQVEAYKQEVLNMKSEFDSTINEAMESTGNFKVSTLDNYTTSALNTALSGKNYKNVIFDTDLTCDAPITVQSNTNYIGDGGKITIVTDVPAFQGIGTKNACVYLVTSTNQMGDAEFTFQEIGSTTVGDYLIMKSDKNLFDYSVVGNYQLGDPTTAGTSVYTEWLTSVTNINNLTVNIADPVPYYCNNTLTATCCVPITNVTFSGLEIVKTASSSVNGVFDIELCYNVLFEQCNVQLNNGYCFYVLNGNHVYIDKNTINVLNSTPEYYTSNVIRVAGCGNSYISNNYVNSPGQPVDLTYVANGAFSYNSYILNNTVYAGRTGITSHPGTAYVTVSDNKIVAVQQGIACRSYSPIIESNTITLTTEFNSQGGNNYAIAIGDGCFVDAKISNNVIKNSYQAIALYDEDTSLFKNNMNITITDNYGECYSFIQFHYTPDNYISPVQLGLDISNNYTVGASSNNVFLRSSLTESTALQNITIRNNVISNMAQMFYSAETFVGVYVVDNVIINNSGFRWVLSTGTGVSIGNNYIQSSTVGQIPNGNTAINVVASLPTYGYDGWTLIYNNEVYIWLNSKWNKFTFSV